MKVEGKIRIYLSHHPGLYALIVGIGIVLFWRGVWHSADIIYKYANFFQNNLTISSVSSPWWDGPLSFLVGYIILFFTGAFTPSFIGNELILSGLRGEKKLHQKTESEVKSEIQSISAIKDGIQNLAGQIEELEKNIRDKDSSPK